MEEKWIGSDALSMKRARPVNEREGWRSPTGLQTGRLQGAEAQKATVTEVTTAALGRAEFLYLRLRPPHLRAPDGCRCFVSPSLGYLP